MKAVVLLVQRWRDQLRFKPERIWRLRHFVVALFHHLLRFSLLLLPLSLDGLVVPEQLLLLEDVLLLRTHQAGLVAVHQLLLQRPADEEVRILVLYQVSQLLQLFLEGKEARLSHGVRMGLSLLLFLVWPTILLLHQGLRERLLVIHGGAAASASSVSLGHLVFGGIGKFSIFHSV